MLAAFTFMPWNRYIGKLEESQALNYLQRKGYTLIRRNWKCCGAEIDIIASKGDQLHFIEVSSCSKDDPAFPVQAVKRRKLQSLVYASRQYIIRHSLWQKVKFTVLSLTLRKDGMDCFLTENIDVR